MKHSKWLGLAGIGLLLMGAASCSGVDKDGNDPGDGTLTGTLSIPTSVTCDSSDTDADCVGTIYVVVLAENPAVNPMQAPQAVQILTDVDLSGSQTVSYTLYDIPVGNWYISGFMDDDGNASSSLPSPSIDDPVGYPAPQVSISKDQTTTQNIALGLRLP